jgi:hypothetical protein
MGLIDGSGTFGVGVTMSLLGIGEVEGVFWLRSRSLASTESEFIGTVLGVVGQSTTGLVSQSEDV